MKHLFVTVGTTKFDELIDVITDSKILKLLEELGYSSIQFQTGNTSLEHFKKIPKYHDINIMYNNFFDNFNEQIVRSDLVISHAGAGSCLEVLKCGKPLVVVVNENLMDNHQIELAKHLNDKGFVFCCTIKNIEETLNKNLSILKPYPAADEKIVCNYLDDCMGFT